MCNILSAVHYVRGVLGTALEVSRNLGSELLYGAMAPE